MRLMSHCAVRDANACPNLHLMALADREGLADTHNDLLGKPLDDRLVTHRGEENDKFIAAKAGDEVGLAH